MKKEVHWVNVLTDEWDSAVIYCTPKEAERYTKRRYKKNYKGFGDVDYDVRAITFWDHEFGATIFINKDLRKNPKDILETAVHESYHLISYVAKRVGIKDDEWFGETLEYVVNQIIKIFKIKIV